MARAAALSESQVVELLRTRYTAPEWAVLAGVRGATGAVATRTVDALAMSLYPSRGLELIGFEVKSHKADWRRELADPDKAETIARFCDRWFVVAGGPGVVPVEEVPKGWGLIECVPPAAPAAPAGAGASPKTRGSAIPPVGVPAPAAARVRLPLPRADDGECANCERQAMPGRGLCHVCSGPPPAVHAHVSREDGGPETCRMCRKTAATRFGVCDVCAPPGVTVPMSHELDAPAAPWTLRVVQGAPLRDLNDAALPRAFVASVFRNAASNWVPRGHVEAVVEAAVKVRTAAAVERATASTTRRASNAVDELRDLKQSVAAFEKAAGVEIGRYDGARIGAAVRMCLENGLSDASAKQAIRIAEERLRHVADRLQALAAEIE